MVYNTDVCEEGDLDYCVSYTDAENCAVCVANYILDSNNKCQEQPYPVISNCSVY